MIKNHTARRSHPTLRDLLDRRVNDGGGWTRQRQIAVLAGVSLGHLNNMIAGRFAVTSAVFPRLCKALGVEADALAGAIAATNRRVRRKA